MQVESEEGGGGAVEGVCAGGGGGAFKGEGAAGGEAVQEEGVH